MNIVITGATGFVGRALISNLQAAGHAITVLSRDPEKARQSIPNIDAANIPDGSSPLPASDIVVNLAGESVSGIWTGKKMRAIRDSRVEGTRRLVASLRAMPVKPSALVSASAVGFYGDRADTILTEDSPAGQGFLAEVCVGWEAEARRAEAFGVRVALPRFGIILGKQGGAMGPMALPFKFGAGGPMGSGRQWFPWVHLDDTIAALRFLIEGELAGPVNITSPNPVRQGDFARLLGKALHRPAIAPAPAFVLRAVLGGFAAELLNSRRVVPARLIDAGFTFRYPALVATLEDLYNRAA